MDEILMTPDTCMKFLVWSYYYHDITPTPQMSYAETGRFSTADARKLDMMKETMFKCFDESSVSNALRQFELAKVRHEPCPFTESELNANFATPIK